MSGRKVMIVTGEASGDLHGAGLVRSMRTMDADLRFFGMGGEEMAAVGVDVLFDAAKVAVVGVVEVFAHLGDILRAQRVLRRAMEAEKPDLLILIDLPDFNLMLAKKAKKLGIPVFYYISPQVWAWRSGRIKVLRERVDIIGVILPFEEEFFRDRGVGARYVGHPLLDSVVQTMTAEEFRRKHAIPDGVRCIGLLPGSRRREINSLLPVFLEAALKVQQRLQQKGEHCVFLLPRAQTITLSELEEAGVQIYKDQLDLRVIEGDRYNLMGACEAVVAASGTVTLELALLNCPMVVTYRLSPLTYRLGRMLVKLEHFSLVNLIAGYGAVPELLQEEVKPDTICAMLCEFLDDAEVRSKMLSALNEVRNRLGGPGASRKAAAAALELLQAGSPQGSAK